MHKKTGLWRETARLAEETINVSHKEQKVLAPQSLLVEESATFTMQGTPITGLTSPALITNSEDGGVRPWEQREVFQTQARATLQGVRYGKIAPSPPLNPHHTHTL